MAFPRPTDFEPGDPDHAAEHNRINEHLNLLHQSDLNRDTLWLRGTGFPTMAAPVGTRYTDTAATNGAIEWIKATGTGTAGWQVSYGDTGWRNVTVTPHANHPGLGSFLIRRANDVVSIAFNETANSLTGVGLTTVFTAPVGFTGRANVPGSSSVINSQSGAPLSSESLYISSGASVALYRSGALRRMGHLTYTSTSAWPTTLPGAPA